MKITLSFLFLGCCLAFTNGFLAGGKKQMKQPEAFATGRLVALIMKRWYHVQNCRNEVEKQCMEKAILHDIIFVLKLASADMGCHPRELIGSMKFSFSVNVMVNAVEKDDVDTFFVFVRTHKQMPHIVDKVCNGLAEPMKRSGVELEAVMGSVNHVVGGVIGKALESLGSLVGGLSGILGGLAGSLGGLTGALGGITGGLGGLTGSLGGITGGLTGGLGGLTGAVGGITGGLTGTLGGATGALGGALGGATGALGGALGGATGALGAATGALGGLGGLAGGLAGGLGGLTGGLGGLGGGGRAPRG